MAGRWACHVLVFIGCMLAVMYTGDPAFIIPVFIQLGMFIFAALDIVHALFFLHIRISADPPFPEKGERANLTVELHNRGFFPCSFIKVWYTTVETSLTGVTHMTPVIILPRRRALIESDMNCRYRGEYHLNIIKLEIRDIFGMLRWSPKLRRLRGKLSLTLVVHPRVLRIGGSSHAESPAEGPVDIRNPMFEDTTSIAQVRAWRPGDPLKRAHWKLSARLRELQIREFDGVALSETSIYLDASAHSLEGEEGAALEDLMTECAASMYKRLSTYRHAVALRFITEDIDVIPPSLEFGFEGILHALATLKFTGRGTLYNSALAEAAGMAHSGLIFITHSFDDRMSWALSSLARTGRRVALIVVLPPGGRTRELTLSLSAITNAGVTAVALSPGEDAAPMLEVAV